MRSQIDGRPVVLRLRVEPHRAVEHEHRAHSRVLPLANGGRDIEQRSDIEQNVSTLQRQTRPGAAQSRAIA